MIDKLELLKKQQDEIQKQIKLNELKKQQENIQHQINAVLLSKYESSKNNKSYMPLMQQETYKGRTISLVNNEYKINDIIGRFSTINEAKFYIDKLMDDQKANLPTQKNKQKSYRATILLMGLLIVFSVGIWYADLEGENSRPNSNLINPGTSKIQITNLEDTAKDAGFSSYAEMKRAEEERRKQLEIEKERAENSLNNEIKAQELAFCAGVLNQWAIGNRQIGNFDKSHKLLNQAENLAQQSAAILGKAKTISDANLGAQYAAEIINSGRNIDSLLIKIEKCENSI